jgi:uncharacterized membrane protein YeaQ/YmgE (transglycosylase-associated protein family)
MGLLWAIILIVVIGAIVGLIARAIMPGRDAMGWGPTIVLGIVGSLIGTLIGSILGRQKNEKFVDMMMPNSIWQFLLAIVGGVVALAIWRAVGGRKTTV